MNKINKLRTKDIGGRFEFFWGRKNITALWMDFFSGLPPDKEKDCVKIFLRRYGKKLSTSI
ncbi:MAG: hypothetical protein AABY22_31215 [Nanoarchaeota archaeon]